MVATSLIQLLAVPTWRRLRTIRTHHRVRHVRPIWTRSRRPSSVVLCGWRQTQGANPAPRVTGEAPQFGARRFLSVFSVRNARPRVDVSRVDVSEPTQWHSGAEFSLTRASGSTCTEEGGRPVSEAPSMVSSLLSHTVPASSRAVQAMHENSELGHNVERSFRPTQLDSDDDMLLVGERNVDMVPRRVASRRLVLVVCVHLTNTSAQETEVDLQPDDVGRRSAISALQMSEPASTVPASSGSIRDAQHPAQVAVPASSNNPSLGVISASTVSRVSAGTTKTMSPSTVTQFFSVMSRDRESSGFRSRTL